MTDRTNDGAADSNPQPAQDPLKSEFDVGHYRLWFEKEGRNLVISVLGTNEKRIFKNWFSSADEGEYGYDSNKGAPEIEAANGWMIRSNIEIQNLVRAMASLKEVRAFLEQEGKDFADLPEDKRIALSGAFSVGWLSRAEWLQDDNKIVGSRWGDTLRGFEGDDKLYGDKGDDKLHGDEGDDRLSGGEGDDKLYGDKGDDKLSGGEGDDKLSGNEGDDRLSGEDGSDRLFGGLGKDKLRGGDGNDTLSGGTGWDDGPYLDVLDGGDRLYGEEGDDTLIGRAGDDRLVGGNGDDGIQGDEGDDHLVGGAGKDLYIFQLGDGVDTIDNSDPEKARDTLEFESGIGHHRLRFEKAGRNLVISVIGTNDRVKVRNWFSNAEPGDYTADGKNSHLTIKAADGRTLTSDSQIANLVKATQEAGQSENGSADLKEALETNWQDDGLDGDNSLAGNDWSDTLLGKGGNDILEGGAGDDTLRGGAGDDKLHGGAGKDTLQGGAGKDEYVFRPEYRWVVDIPWPKLSRHVLLRPSDGVYVIDNSDSSPDPEQDRLKFEDDIHHDRLWFEKENGNLVISILGTSDEITVKDWFSSADNRHLTIEAGDGRTLTLDSQIQNLVNAMAGDPPAANGIAGLPKEKRDTVETAIAANWKQA